MEGSDRMSRNDIPNSLVNTGSNILSVPSGPKSAQQRVVAIVEY